jgi:hypothetical protein
LSVYFEWHKLVRLIVVQLFSSQELILEAVVFGSISFWRIVCEVFYTNGTSSSQGFDLLVDSFCWKIRPAFP